MSDTLDATIVFRDLPTIGLINNCRPTARLFMPGLKSSLEDLSFDVTMHEVPSGSSIAGLADLLGTRDVVLVGVGD